MYILINLNTNDGISCSNELWATILSTGRKYGWKPEGTVYDFIFELDDTFDEDDDALLQALTVIMINNRRLDWNGSYLEKENQIVTNSDAEALCLAIKNTGLDPDIILFIQQGSFRIRAI